MLESTRASGPWSEVIEATSTVLVDERPDVVFGDGRTGRRNHQPPTFPNEALARDRFDPDAAAVDGHLDLTTGEPRPLAQGLGDDDPTCLVDGRTHGRRLPVSCQ